jgi:hypothetical protein
MSVTLYPGGDNPVTPNLGLALWDMSMTMAENFELLDSAVAAGSLKVNEALVTAPNFVNSPTVTFSAVGSNISLNAADDFLSLAGNTPTTPVTGSIYCNASFTLPVVGDFTGGWTTEDVTGNIIASGNSSLVGGPAIFFTVPGFAYYFSADLAGVSFNSLAGATIEILKGSGVDVAHVGNSTGNAGMETDTFSPDSNSFYGDPVVIGQSNDTISSNSIVISSATGTIVNGPFIEATTKTPASSSAAGVTGQIAWDQSYIYVCLNGSTPKWGRAALTSTGW